MKDEIINLVKQITTERNLMLEQMAASAVAKWGIDNVKLCHQIIGDKSTHWFEPIKPQPQPAPAPVPLCDTVKAYIAYIEDDSIPVSRGDELLKNIRLSLAAEVKRQEAVNRVIEDAKKLRDVLSEFGNESLAFSRTVINLYVSLDALDGGAQ